MFKSVRSIFICGIGGIGMSSIAELLFRKGYNVAGSDRTMNDVTARLASLGITIYSGHDGANIGDADVIVYSSAVNVSDNPEVRAALAKGVPAIKRPEMLAEITRTKYCIGVAGSHGKTSTTSMTGLTLIAAGFDPSLIVGGTLSALGGANARLGDGAFIVVEADEFDRTFLSLNPAIAVITNIEKEHLETYKDLDDIKSAFITFANKVPFYGHVIACVDEPGVKDILPSINRPVVTYGISEGAEIRASNIVHAHSASEFDVLVNNNKNGRFIIGIPGIHNVKNALAAIAVAMILNADMQKVKVALKEFKGAGRRFEIKYSGEIIVVDDYAHHPTETTATLLSAKSGWKRRVVAVFQPHLFSRTREFAEEFGKSFMNADVFVCTDVYPSRETPIPGITGELIVQAARAAGHTNAAYVSDKSNLPQYLKTVVKNDDIVLFMGAGDITSVCAAYTSGLKGEARA